MDDRSETGLSSFTSERHAEAIDMLAGFTATSSVLMNGKSNAGTRTSPNVGEGFETAPGDIRVGLAVPGGIESKGGAQALRRPRSLRAIPARVEIGIRIFESPPRAFAHLMPERAARKSGRVGIVGDIPRLVEKAGGFNELLVATTAREDERKERLEGLGSHGIKPLAGSQKADALDDRQFPSPFCAFSIACGGFSGPV